MKTCEDMVKALEERMAWVAAEVSNADASKEEAAKELQAAKTGLKTDMEVRAGLQVCSSGCLQRVVVSVAPV